MSTESSVYLVTGASRGIGLSIVNAIADKFPSAIIYAGARSPSNATQLQQLSSKYPGRILIVEYVSGDVEGNQVLAKQIDEKHGRLDVVIANAGIANYLGTAFETPVDEIREHFEVNTFGVLVLFQAVFSLLKRGVSPKFIPISSGAASLVAYIGTPVGHACYGASKAALNYIARKIHFENEWLVCFPLAPGVVDTDMAKTAVALDKSGYMAPLIKEFKISVEDTGTMLVDIIHGSTRATHGGEFINVDGSKIPW